MKNKVGLLLLALLPLGLLHADQIKPKGVYVNTLFTGLPVETIESMIATNRITSEDKLIMNKWPECYLSDNNYFVYQNWIVIDLGGKYDLSQIKIWNYCDTGTYQGLLGRGVKNASIWVSENEDTRFCYCTKNGNSWTPISPSNTRNYDLGADGEDKFYTEFGWKKIWTGEIPEGELVPEGTEIDPHQILDVQNKNIRYVGISVKSRWEGDSYTKTANGLQYILVKGVPSQGPSQISPPDMGKAIPTDTQLTWAPPANGKTVLRYRVFLDSADENAETEVTDHDTDRDETNCSFTFGQPLSGNTTYFWKVEAVLGDNSTLCSPVWSFTTKYPASEFPVIHPVGSFANTSFSKATPNKLVNDSVLDEMGRMRMPFLTGDQYLSSMQGLEGAPVENAVTNISMQWICFDLGHLYKLDRIKIWNYLESNPDNVDRVLRGVKKIRIYIGKENAICPKKIAHITNTNSEDYLDAFAGVTGWEEVFSGDLKRNPAGYLLRDGDAFPETDVIPLKKRVGRYLAIDIDTSYWNQSMTDYNEWRTFTFVGLGHVQITGKKYDKGSLVILK